MYSLNGRRKHQMRGLTSDAPRLSSTGAPYLKRALGPASNSAMDREWEKVMAMARASSTTAARVRTLTPAEVNTVIDWADAEGWNPGCADARPFLAADPDAFLGAFVGGKLVGCISICIYDEKTAFLGFFIVGTEHRRRGYGAALMAAALARAGGRVVGLDGVHAQVGRYESLGFQREYLNVRMGGLVTPEAIVSLRAHADPLVGVVPYEVGFIHAIERFEAFSVPGEAWPEQGCLFPARRPSFLRAWFSEPGHVARVAFTRGVLSGYGVVRPTRSGAFRVGPLFAADGLTASALLASLLGQIGVGVTVLIDVPEPHELAMTLVKSIGFGPVFECVRMYRGVPPALCLSRIFAITSCELG
jgi:GNAT superfamily N-acetyltransferase